MRGVRRFLACSFVLLVSIGASGAAHASVREEVLAVVRDHLVSRGASEVTELERTFLFEGESRVREERLEATGCVGWLALGFGDVRDVDLSVNTLAGQSLAEDVGAAPYAYVRTCAERGTRMYVSAVLYAGRGELMLLRIDGAPRELGRLPASLPFAVSAGGRIETSRSVGTGVDDAAFDGFVAHEERALSELGYIGMGPMVPVELRAGLGGASVLLTAGHCYRVVALVPFARGVGVAVLGGEGDEKRGQGPKDRATAYVCARESGPHAVRVESRALRAIALMRVFEHPEASLAALRGHPDAEVLGAAEAAYVAHAHGLELSLLGEAWLDASSALVWPVTLRRGACYAFAVTGEQGLGGVDARLTDPTSVIVVRNEGQRPGPSLFYCAAQDGSHQLSLRSRGPHAKVSVWLAQDARSGS